MAGDFFDSTTTRKAYLGKHAFDLMNLSGQQAAEIYVKKGLRFPIETSSTLQYLHRQGVLSVADVARALDLPHQLATQRVEKLIKHGLVRRRPDPNDGRRSRLHLTKKGREQAELLNDCMAEVAQLYHELFEEIGCDLSEMLPRAVAALRAESLPQRLARKERDTQRKGA